MSPPTGLYEDLVKKRAELTELELLLTEELREAVYQRHSTFTLDRAKRIAESLGLPPLGDLGLYEINIPVTTHHVYRFEAFNAADAKRMFEERRHPGREPDKIVQPRLQEEETPDRGIIIEKKTYRPKAGDNRTPLYYPEASFGEKMQAIERRLAQLRKAAADTYESLARGGVGCLPYLTESAKRVGVEWPVSKKRYTVTVPVAGVVTIVTEASSEEEARRQAEAQVRKGRGYEGVAGVVPTCGTVETLVTDQA